MSNADKKVQESQAQRELELNDLRFLLASDQGKRFFMRLLDRAGIHRPTYASGSNTHDFAFLEGRRDAGLFLLAEITQANSNAWLDMQKTHFEQLKKLDEQVKYERNNSNTNE